MFCQSVHINRGTPPREDTRVPRAYEDQGWPQSAGGSPQEGPSSPHARVMAKAPRRARSFLAKPSWCGKASLIWCTAPASAARVPTSLFSFAPVDSRSAASGSASRRLGRRGSAQPHAAAPAGNRPLPPPGDNLGMGHRHSSETECGHGAASGADRGFSASVEGAVNFPSDGRRSFGVRAALFALSFYKAYLSALFAGTCRYEPTCSRYAYEANRAIWGVARRLARIETPAAVPPAVRKIRIRPGSGEMGRDASEFRRNG